MFAQPVMNPAVAQNDPNSVKIDITQDPAMEVLNNSSDPKTSKPWLKRPGAPVVKVAPDVKRRRRNYQAKKLLVPKNPLMILNELKPGLVYTFSEDINDDNTAVFVATVQVDGLSFCGKGTSKKLAQQEASEAALRGLYFDKLMDRLEKKEDGDVDMKDGNNSADDQIDSTPKQSTPEDDTPWAGLASFAMFKLASLWQKDVGNSRKTLAIKNPFAKSQVAEHSTDLKGKIPANASTMDPVMLLNQISPHSKYIEIRQDLFNGSLIFTLSVDFNGCSYLGSATKKKMAKKICAKAALASIGVEFNDENNSNHETVLP